jgi:hypothetical protein
MAELLAHFKTLVLATLVAFLPLTALTYYVFRRSRRLTEVQRILELLSFTDEERGQFLAIYCGRDSEAVHYILAVGFATVVTTFGLALLLYSGTLHLADFPTVSVAGTQFPRQGSRLLFAMAALGAYLWGVQHVLRRYWLNDLHPAVYYGLSARLMLAGVLAVVTFNGAGALSGGGSTEGPGITAAIWPTLAFLLGMFPERGLHWLTNRAPIFAAEPHPAATQAPLEMIEGMEAGDVVRLGEQGIDNCHDLANTDFLPMLLKCPYSARQLADWILQAKLCASFGDAVVDLRRFGVHNILDLDHLKDAARRKLPTETAVTETSLSQAQRLIEDEREEIERLVTVRKRIGHFIPYPMDESPTTPASEGTSSESA